ncbi:MarR family winged helix-turn-helix transcriptional regulator [Allosphingosinicella vermicomposti]|uniref:MarR family winged helix-turn-helix transcriptional regulator n=1 Tax=Allosphingosinicella vermicomposti TaxID=614671 RepID=UPI00131A5A30|nr:MarR family winged helix-turn-helix transcriptional regulator [Allosphingosinicella vermicomposti]
MADTGNELGLVTRRIAQAVKQLEALTVFDPPSASPYDTEGYRLEKMRKVRTYIRTRRLREQLLPGDLFGEPAWDILVDLYAADLEQKKVSISSACIAASVPATTALRWLNRLIAYGLVTKTDDQVDARRTYVRLSLSGSNAVGTWVDEALLQNAN